MKLFGQNTKLTELAGMIMSENILALEKQRLKGFLKINDKFLIAPHLNKTPLTLALCENKIKVVDWLIGSGVELNDPDSPSIIIAGSNCSLQTIKVLLDNGADINAKDNLGKTAMTVAISGKRLNVISYLIEKGYDLSKDYHSLREAVASENLHIVKLLIENGADINYCEPDMVYPSNPTPVHIAAKRNNWEILKLLIENGADLTVKDRYGERPYNCACENSNYEMMKLIEALEPTQWHDREKKLLELQNHGVPERLISIISSKERLIKIPKNDSIKYLIVNSLFELKMVEWNGRQFIDLIKEVDNYWNEGFLVWYPKGKCLANADYEHGTFKEICSVDDFFENPSTQLDKIVAN